MKSTPETRIESTRRRPRSMEALSRLLNTYRPFASPISIIGYATSRRLSTLLSSAGFRTWWPSLAMRYPFSERIVLRPGTSDTAAFREVFVAEVYASVIENVTQCDTLIDLGANIGLSSLLFGHHYHRAQIFAVEPNPDSHRVLERNLRSLSKAGRCRTAQLAVWDRECELEALDAASAEALTFALHEAPDAPAATGRGMSVAAASFERILDLSGFTSVDLLKVDIEGAEDRLFSGACDWLDSIRALAIEFHEGTREAIGFDALMAGRGFEIVADGDHTTLAIRRRGRI